MIGENEMSDILFKTDDYVFSYRVAGICIQNGRVLLQKPTNTKQLMKSLNCGVQHFVYQE